jgi:hypothetical protein
MSHSRIFDEFAKIMSEKGLFKTAEKKDKAGPDTKVDKTGYELTEIAHPEQIQVAESRLNDGIVENGVEQQKAMIDVALRNPRGVLASVMQTLIKVANTLDEELTEDSLKLAAEIDTVISKIAREALSSDDLWPLVEEVLNRFGDLDFSTAGFSSAANKAAKKVVYQTSLQLKNFLQDAKAAGSGVGELVQNMSAFIRGASGAVKNALENTTDWGSDAEDALEAWDNLKLVTDQWYQEPEKAPAPAAAPTEQKDVAGKKPAMPHHNYSASGDDVKVLQGLIGATQDGKFGPQTFSALQQAAKNNSLLAQLMEQPETPKSYQGWTDQLVGEATQRIKAGGTGAVQQQPKSQIIPAGVSGLMDTNKMQDFSPPDTRQPLTPYQTYEEGYQGGKSEAKG